ETSLEVSPPNRMSITLVSCYSLVEAEVFSSVFRISEEEHLIVKPHLPPIVGRCLNLEIIDTVLTRFQAQGSTNLLHVEFEHTLPIDADDRRESCDLHVRLLAHDISDDIPFDARAHGHSTMVRWLA